jgi:hypothetical protein
VVIKTEEFDGFNCKQERLFNFLIALEKADNWKDFEIRHLTSDTHVFEQQI